MKNYFIILFFLLPLYLISQTRKGKVVRVTDGDTIIILDSTNRQLRVRLYGVDAPEKGQDFSNVAKQFISDLCFSKIVSIDIKDIDRYGRTVGIVWTDDSTNLNLELLRSGLARHYKIFDKSDDFAQAEYLARINKVGLWREPNAAPPWKFRRKK